MPRDGAGRRLLSAVADSTPAFTHTPADDRQGRGRRLLSALADSTSAFRRESNPDKFISRPPRSAGNHAEERTAAGAHVRSWDGRRSQRQDPQRRSGRYFNVVRTALMLGGTIMVIVLISSLWGRTALFIGLAVALLTTGYAYFSSNRLALKAMRARPVSQFEQPAMYRIVRELAMSARQPMPRLYISPTVAPNAFATGRTPRNAAVCCTTGILQLLDERELRAVLGHLLARVYNRDTLLLSVAGALSSTVTVIGILGSSVPMASDDDRPNPLAVLLLSSLGPLAAIIVRIVVSSSVYRHADTAGADLTGDPLALASALRKLDAGTRAAPLSPEPAIVTQSHMMIVSPFRPGETLARLFMRHPPVLNRVRSLEDMAEHGRN